MNNSNFDSSMPLKAMGVVNVTPQLPEIWLDEELWSRFVEHLRSNGGNLQEYLQIALNDEINNALRDNLI